MHGQGQPPGRKPRRGGGARNGIQHPLEPLAVATVIEADDLTFATSGPHKHCEPSAAATGAATARIPSVTIHRLRPRNGRRTTDARGARAGNGRRERLVGAAARTRGADAPADAPARERRGRRAPSLPSDCGPARRKPAYARSRCTTAPSASRSHHNARPSPSSAVG